MEAITWYLLILSMAVTAFGGSINSTLSPPSTSIGSTEEPVTRSLTVVGLIIIVVVVVVVVVLFCLCCIINFIMGFRMGNSAAPTTPVLSPSFASEAIPQYGRSMSFDTEAVTEYERSMSFDTEAVTEYERAIPQTEMSPSFAPEYASVGKPAIPQTEMSPSFAPESLFFVPRYASVGKASISVRELDTYNLPLMEARRIISLTENLTRGLASREEVDVSILLYKEQYIDRNGGVIVLPEADVSLIVPPGAITEGCIISINVIPTSSVALPYQGLPRLTPLVICEPEGMEFQRPVELILPHCGVIDDPATNKVYVEFGKKLHERYISKDMNWIKEEVEYKLTRRFCHVFLKHFSGVNVNISDTKEKMLRAIPFVNAMDDGDLNQDVILNMWFCNDLPADYLNLLKNEIKNKNIPLDSYDTFRLNTSEDLPKPYIEVTTEEMVGSNWQPETSTKKLDIHGLATKTKSKCTFRYANRRNNNEYFYVTIRIGQKMEEDERESFFVLRKRRSDISLKSECLRTENAFFATTSSLSDSGRPQSEHPPKSCIAIPFVDSMINHSDDILLTLWLLSEESAEKMLSNFVEEQELLHKMKFDTENTFTIRDAKKPVTSTVRFRKGSWKPKSDTLEVDIGKVLRGTRTKFPFICRKEAEDNEEGIDVEISVVQERTEIRTEFMKSNKVKDFLRKSIEAKKEIPLQAVPPGESSEKFAKLCHTLISQLSEDNCRYLATYFDFRPANVEEVVSSDRPSETLIRMLKERMLFAENKLGWLQSALKSIFRVDLADAVGRFKMESQNVD